MKIIKSEKIFENQQKNEKSTNIFENTCKSLENQFRPTNSIRNKLELIQQSEK